MEKGGRGLRLKQNPKLTTHGGSARRLHEPRLGTSMTGLFADVGWAKPTGRANARPMTGSACPPSKFTVWWRYGGHGANAPLPSLRRCPRSPDAAQRAALAARCAADPGSILLRTTAVQIGPGSAKQRCTLHRVRDTITVRRNDSDCCHCLAVRRMGAAIEAGQEFLPSLESDTHRAYRSNRWSEQRAKGGLLRRIRSSQ
jgi:hypothetical protein